MKPGASSVSGAVCPPSSSGSRSTTFPRWERWVSISFFPLSRDLNDDLRLFRSWWENNELFNPQIEKLDWSRGFSRLMTPELKISLFVLLRVLARFLDFDLSTLFNPANCSWLVPNGKLPRHRYHERINPESQLVFLSVMLGKGIGIEGYLIVDWYNHRDITARLTCQLQNLNPVFLANRIFKHFHLELICLAPRFAAVPYKKSKQGFVKDLSSLFQAHAF